MGEVLRGFALVPVAFIGVTIITLGLRAIAPWLHTVNESPLLKSMSTPTDAAVFLVVVVLGAGIKEELQRRSSSIASSTTSEAGASAWPCSADGSASSISNKARRRRLHRSTWPVLGRALPRAAIGRDEHGESRVLQRGAGRPGHAGARAGRLRGWLPPVRVLCFADTRFPIERANGVQTFQTCHALARRDTTSRWRSGRTRRPAARSVRLLRASGERRLTVTKIGTPGPVPARRLAYLLGPCVLRPPRGTPLSLPEIWASRPGCISFRSRAGRRSCTSRTACLPWSPRKCPAARQA